MQRGKRDVRPDSLSARSKGTLTRHPGAASSSARAVQPPSPADYAVEPQLVRSILQLIPETSKGDIHVTTKAGDEIWSPALSEWNNYYVLPATAENVAGQYTEVLAEFALDGDTIMSVDLAGKLSFQSAHSGCGTTIRCSGRGCRSEMGHRRRPP